MKALLLVDLSAIFWWLWHGSASQSREAPYERTLGKVIQLAEGYARVAVCCDAGTSWRREIYPDYKGNRPPHDTEAIEQLDSVKKELARRGFTMFEAPGFEADDIIATCVEWFWQKGPSHGEVHIASRDKDMLQLVWWNDSNGNGTLALDPQSGKLGGPVEVEARYGVTPAQMVDFLALVGDSSDNVRGVEKVGAKHAQRLLAKYGTASKLWGALDEKKDGKWAIEPPSVRDSLIASADIFALARKLITLRTDAPIDCTALEKEHETSAGFAAGEGTQQTSHTQPGRGADEPGTFSDAEFEEEADTEPAPPQASALPLHATPSQPQGAAPPSPAGVAEEPGTSTALATVRHERFALALEPSNVSNAYTLAKHLYNSGLFRAHSNPDSIFAVIMTGRTMGLDALTSLRGMHIIEGKPQISAALMVGMVLRSGLAEYFECIESTDERATWETKRVGARKERKESFTMKDADVAGYTRKSNSGKPTQWQKGPRTMLRWRAAAELAREVYPDVVSNVYIPGELEEAS